MGNQLIDEIGNRYGQLVVLSRADNIDTGAAWLCQCDCGNTTIVRGYYLRSGMTKSCGHLIPGEIAAFNSLFAAYRAKAESRGREWVISKEKFRELTSQPCYYCGIEPFQVCTIRNQQTCIYNGLDRVDNEKDYIEGNVVPCCGDCNFAKGSMTQAEFLELIRRIYALHGE